MRINKWDWLLRLAAGAALGAVLTDLLVYLICSFRILEETPCLVFEEAVAFYGSRGLAFVVQSLLGGLFGGVIATATLPFAETGRQLLFCSLVHFLATELSFALLLVGCRWTVSGPALLLWLGLLALLYALIWLGRWIGWYAEVVQIRRLLGLSPGPSPLKWRETLPYLPLALALCDLLPLVLRWIDRTFVVDVPVFSGLILPYLVLPTVGFLSGMSLGKRQGICPLYPAALFICYLPMVFLLYNASAFFHCFMVSVPALAGNVVGWLYRRSILKSRGR